MHVVNPLVSARIAYRICLLAAALSALPAALTYAADLNQNLKFGSPWVVAQAKPAKKTTPQASPVAPNPTGAEIVGKLLANPPSDPDVPLPQRDLTTRERTSGPFDSPKIYGRQEEGGGVFGLKIPIPADRSAVDRHTRSSVGSPVGD